MLESPYGSLVDVDASRIILLLELVNEKFTVTNISTVTRLFRPLHHLSRSTVTFCSIIYMIHLLLISTYENKKQISFPLAFYLIFSPFLFCSNFICLQYNSKRRIETILSRGQQSNS